MSETDFRRLTIDAANALPVITDMDFLLLPGYVRDHITAHAESKGGNWERDGFRGCYRNRHAPAAPVSQGWLGMAPDAMTIGCGWT